MDEWKCRFCGEDVYTYSRVSLTGWVVMLAGLLLAPVCVGLVLVPIGFFIRENYVACDTHGRDWA